MKYRNKECGYIVDVFHCDYDKTIPNWMEKKIEDGSIIVKTEAQKNIYFFKTKYGVNVESIEGSWITYDGEFLMLYSQDGFFDLFSAISLPNNYLRYSCDVVKPIPVSKEGDANCIRTIAKKLLDEFKDYVKNMTLEEFNGRIGDQTKMKEEKALLYLIIFLMIALLSLFGYCIYKGWAM